MVHHNPRFHLRDGTGYFAFSWPSHVEVQSSRAYQEVLPSPSLIAIAPLWTLGGGHDLEHDVTSNLTTMI